jgi:hypothetical protein
MIEDEAGRDARVDDGDNDDDGEWRATQQRRHADALRWPRLHAQPTRRFVRAHKQSLA